MSHQGFDITFEEFKEQFYSKIGDGSCLNVLDINLLKVVLDGLKVKYTHRGKISEYLSKPTIVILGYYLLKIIIDRLKRIRLQKRKNELRDRKFLTAFADRIYKEDNKTYCVYFENIYERYGRNNFCCVKKSTSTHFLHADIDTGELAFDFNIFDKYNFKLLLELKKHLKTLRKSGKWTVDELNNISIAYFLFFNEFLKFDAFLKNMNFSTALIDCHYHDEGFILACKKNNIKVIELQHGLISKADIFFVIPKQLKSCTAKALFADKIFVYGTYWKDVLLNGSEYSDEQINVIGYYQFEGKSKARMIKSDRKRILITTQNSIESYFINYVKWLSPRLDEDWEIVVKIHPSESKEIYRELVSYNNVIVTDSNLNSLIESCEFTISVFSTTLFDALRNRKIAFSLNFELFKDYVDDIVSTNAIYLLEPDENPIDKFNSIDAQQHQAKSKAFYDKFNPTDKLDDLLLPQIS